MVPRDVEDEAEAAMAKKQIVVAAKSSRRHASSVRLSSRRTLSGCSSIELEPRAPTRGPPPVAEAEQLV